MTPPKAYRDRMEELRRQEESHEIGESPQDEPAADLRTDLAQSDPPSPAAGSSQKTSSKKDWCPRCKAPALKGKAGVPYKCARCHDRN